MAYESNGLAALFPVYLARMGKEQEDREAYNALVAQNEVNLNQNLENIVGKIAEIEAYLAAQNQ